MSRALVLGASGGVGAALAEALAARGVEVIGLSRSRDGLDLTRAETVAAAAERLGAARFEVILNAVGALVIDGAQPEKSFEALDPGAMAAQFALNATGVALAVRHFAPLLAGRQEGARAVFGSLSARVGSIGDNRLGGWVSYRAAKAAQNQILRTAAVEWGRRHRGAIFVALHPGTVATPLSADYAARHPTISPAQSAEALLAVIDGLTPAESGSFWDWKGERVPW